MWPLTLAVIAVALPVGGNAPPSPALLATAQKLFEQGQYQAAAGIYDECRRHGAHNGPFYLNQGNAHFAAGNLPEAILAYRRAERFIPGDPRLLENLAEARRQVLDPPAQPGSAWPAWLPRPGRPWQVRLAMGGYLLGWALLTLWLFQRRWLIAGGGCVAFALALGGWAYREDQYDRQRPVAVVADDGVVFRKGNGDSYPAVEVSGVALKLNRGVEARVLGDRPNGWVQLELADGVPGWTPRAALLIDEPP